MHSKCGVVKKSLLAQLIELLAEKGITSIDAIAEYTGRSRRQVFRAKAELQQVSPMTPQASVTHDTQTASDTSDTSVTDDIHDTNNTSDASVTQAVTPVSFSQIEQVSPVSPAGVTDDTDDGFDTEPAAAEWILPPDSLPGDAPIRARAYARIVNNNIKYNNNNYIYNNTTAASSQNNVKIEQASVRTDLADSSKELNTPNSTAGKVKITRARENACAGQNKPAAGGKSIFNREQLIYQLGLFVDDKTLASRTIDTLLELHPLAILSGAMIRLRLKDDEGEIRSYTKMLGLLCEDVARDHARGVRRDVLPWGAKVLPNGAVLSQW